MELALMVGIVFGIFTWWARQRNGNEDSEKDMDMDFLDGCRRHNTEQREGGEEGETK